MGTPRLLDRFITAAEAFDKDFFMESYLLKAFLNKVEEALALAIWSKVLFCIFSSFHAVRRFVCWFMLRVEPFVLLWLHCKHSSGAGSRRFRRFFCIFIW